MDISERGYVMKMEIEVKILPQSACADSSLQEGAGKSLPDEGGG